MSRFVDQVTAQVRAGSGGDGVITWRREAHVPMGGPSGGNGGNGGSVIFWADPGLNTLIDFSYSPIAAAEDGDPGSKSDCDGACAKDIVRAVPVGTQVFWNDDLVADLSVPHARWIAARGGRGGKGNRFFKNSRNQAPGFAERGQPGESHSLRLVVKSIADIGLVGLPNVGKSTLLSAISQARPKIANYPFTTLEPQLGVVEHSGQRVVVADIPGLIEGAHAGKGLGLDFLKHIERTKALIHMLDATFPLAEEPELIDDNVLRTRVLDQLKLIQEELKEYSPALAEYPRVIVFSKADLPETVRAFHLLANELGALTGNQPILISSHTGEGLDALKSSFLRLLNADSTDVIY